MSFVIVKGPDIRGNEANMCTAGCAVVLKEHAYGPGVTGRCSPACWEIRWLLRSM
jgi:hypothetical protein